MADKSMELTESEEKMILDFKNEMHKNPELSHEEFDTTDNIKNFLSKIDNIEILPISTKTGVVACIKGSGDGPSVGLRCDIDAIRQNEEYDSPYKSQKKGIMHACGHDFHTASLLGSALILSRNKDRLKGDIYLLFQEAEETTDGAFEMISSGLWDVIKPDYFFGIHNRPEIDSGYVVVKKGALMAAKTNFIIHIKGLGGHGSMPDKCIDPIVCAAAMIQSLQTIVSRNVAPIDAAVLTIGSIHGGSIENLVVEDLSMTGSIRAIEADTMKKMIKRLEQIVSSTGDAYECKTDIEYKEVLPPVYNKDDMYDIAYKAASKVVGENHIVSSQPTLASEDFAIIMEKIPSFFYWIGSGIASEDIRYAWHQSRFHTDDNGIKIGAMLLAYSAIEAQKA